VVQGKRFQFARGIDTVKVDVVEGDAGSAVLVDEGKGRAGHVFGESGIEAFRDALDEGGLSCPEVAAQQHDERGKQFGGKPAAESDRLLGGVSDGLGRHSGGFKYSEAGESRS